jgi:hypothetical protein
LLKVTCLCGSFLPWNRMTWFGVKRQAAEKQATCGNNSCNSDWLPLLAWPLLHSGFLGGGKIPSRGRTRVAPLGHNNILILFRSPSRPTASSNQYRRPIRQCSLHLSDILSETMPRFYMATPHNPISTAQVPFETVCEIGNMELYCIDPSNLSYM